jgi:hypothetical protein
MILRKIMTSIVGLLFAAFGTLAFGTFLESQLPGRQFAHGMAEFLLLIFAAGSYAVAAAALARLRSHGPTDFTRTLPLGFTNQSAALRGSRIALAIAAVLRRTGFVFFLLPLGALLVEFVFKIDDGLRFDQALGVGIVVGVVYLVLSAICQWIAR